MGGLADEPKDRPRAEILARHTGLVGRTALVSVLTLVSRLLGFLREILMASVFGDGSAVSDAFFTAWRVPNLFRRLFGEGALSTSLQAAITEVDAEEGNDAGRRLFLSTLRTATVLLLVVSLVSMLCIARLPDEMPLTGWAWMGADPGPVRDLAVRLVPYVLLVCLTALAGGALFVRGHYFVPNLAPAAMNLCWIGALLWMGWVFGFAESAQGSRDVVFARQWDMARVLAWGVLASGLVQLLLHLPPLLRFGLLRPPASPLARPGATRTQGRSGWAVIRDSAPLALGAAVYQINVMIDGLMAEGMLADGGPTALYYANRVQQFPFALIATAAIASVFPRMKAHGHLGEFVPLRRLYDRAQLGVLFLALPAAAGLLALAHPISVTLFQHGNYGAEGTRRVGEALAMLAIALVPAGAVGLLGRTYIALGDLRTPVRVSVWMMGLNVALNVLFVRGLGMDVGGLALATAVTSWGNLLVLSLVARKKLGFPAREGGRYAHVGLLVLAGIATGAAARIAWSVLGDLGDAPRLLVATAAGALAMAAVSHFLKLPEWDELRVRLGRRRNRP